MKKIRIFLLGLLVYSSVCVANIYVAHKVATRFEDGDVQKMLKLWVRDSSSRKLTQNGYMYQPSSIPLSSIEEDKRGAKRYVYYSRFFKGNNKTDKEYAIIGSLNGFELYSPQHHKKNRIKYTELIDQYAQRTAEFEVD